jgi:chorismate mutase
MEPLIRLTRRRLVLGDLVAAAKFGTLLPIDDPVREEEVLAGIARMAEAMGVDAALSRRFFVAQIEANKAVQRGLHALWAQEPGHRPARSPDLHGEVRPRLDRLDRAILHGMRAVELPLRLPGTRAGGLTDPVARLHENALLTALAPLAHQRHSRRG